MAFSYGGTPSASAAGVNAQAGKDLPEILTEGLGWSELYGESKLQLLPSSWPADQLPPPTASLMSIASHKGLVAAAGPNTVIVAKTESVRKAFEGPKVEDSNIKPFQPELSLPMPMRISQVAFTADESYLVLAAEVGGGLAVYDVQSLLQGSTQSAFELPTNGQAVRALVPNPTAEKGELLALVLDDGSLMMANLKTRSFNNGLNGQVLKSGVSCVSWSTKGKQLVAGLATGAAYQMTPEGEGKADIPRPPAAEPSDHVSSVTWLENHCFMMILTPSSHPPNDNAPSTFFVVTRDPKNQTNFTFQKIGDPVGHFGLTRTPPHHFLLRLRDFPPNLQDALVVASTASNEIGLFTRSKIPLTNDKPADQVTGCFTMTEMSDDSRRAGLPMDAELNDTSPIGFAFDLSIKEKVWKPIPTDDEIDESPTPVPALMVLNNQGVLASWWFIYSESIRQSTIYPGLTAAEGSNAMAVSSTASTQPAAQPFGASKPAFGASTGAFGSSVSTPSAFGKPASTSAFGANTGAFGTPATPSAFGSSAAPGAFGASSALGQSKSPWGASTAVSAAPASTGAFGGSSALGQSQSPWGTPAPSNALGAAPATSAAFGNPSFGQTSTPSLGMGNKASPWATGSTAPSAAFGQSGGIAKPANPFGSSTPQNGPSASGFASFASKGGFAAAPSPSGTTGSVFGAGASNSTLKSTTSAFGSSAVSTSPFGSSPTPTSSIFGAATGPSKPSGLGGPFVLGSTFKADPSSSNDNETTAAPKSSFFGGNFGSTLTDATTQPALPETKDAEMDADETVNEEPAKVETSTPMTTPAAPKMSLFPSSTPASGGLFGLPAKPSDPVPTKSENTGFSFGKPSTSPKPGGFFANLNQSTATRKTSTSVNAPTNPFARSLSPKIKEEPDSESSILNKMPEAPFPPNPSSKVASGKMPISSVLSSSTNDSKADTSAPLPPDFLSKPILPKKEPTFSLISEKKPIPTDLVPPMDAPGGPSDDGESSGFHTENEDDLDSEEGSGEDVTKDLSPISETRPTPSFSPDSSFGGPKTRSNIFPKPSAPSQSRSLFGEVGKSAPFLPPPVSKLQESPRSPSPIRTALPPRMSRPDTSRSVSAPGTASQLLGNKRIGGRAPVPSSSNPSNYELSLQQRQAEERRRAESKVKKEEEETKALEDEEDDRIQQHLASEIVPTRVLDEFEAHINYVSSESTESIQAQVETVYRDINAMIDTLGINSRTLKSFIQGHSEQYKEEGRTRSDLEKDDDWCLVEIEDLSAVVENELARELESGRVKDVPDKIEACTDLEKDLGRLRAKHEEVKKVYNISRDPDQIANARAQPLTSEQLAQQNDLRRDFTTFQKLLSEAEEGLILLKAKLVSQTASQGKVGSTGPTVEAVMRTIAKMTSMAEKRSGDVDVLEGQMRKLRFSSSTGSREETPFETPQKSYRASVRTPGPGTYGFFPTPENGMDSSQRFRSSMMSSTGSFGKSVSPRKKMSGYTADEKLTLRSKQTRKKEVTDKLRAALAKSGTHVRTMDSE